MIIAGAGGAAHLPGMTAALTPLPVFGVPVESKALSGQDSLLSIVQMPAGIPVGTLAIGKSGAVNAALLAAAVLALSDADLAKRLDDWRAKQTDAVADVPVGRRMRRRFRPAPRSASSAAASSAACWRWPRRGSATARSSSSRRPDCPAAQVANRQIVAAYDDPAALDELAGSAAVVTYEFENVPVAAAEAAGAQRSGLSAAACAGGLAGPAGRKALPQRGRDIHSFFLACG